MNTYLEALLTCFEPVNFILLLSCSVAGVIFGAIPGLNGGMGVTLLLPLTFSMSTNASFCMLIGMYIGGVSGGFVSSTLLGIPGTPSSIATCFDAYPMSRRGETSRALGLGIIGSFIGSIVSVIIAMFLCNVIADLALNFGPWEYFSLCFCAITLVAALSKGSAAKGMLAAAIGLLLGCIGLDPLTGHQRLTFGIVELSGGVDLTALMLGAFALQQIMLSYARGSQKLPDVMVQNIKGIGVKIADFTKNIKTIISSLLIGLWIGFLPGMGSALSNMVSYSFAKSSSKRPEEFGTGCAAGILASEVSNNAACGGAMIPMLALGIPGDGVTALLLSALTIHGLTAGPLMIQANPLTADILFCAMILSACLVFILQLVSKRWFPYLLRIPYHYLYTAIIIMCFIGAFTATNTLFNIGVMIVMAFVGVAMESAGIPSSPMILAFILSGNIDQYLRNGITYAHGNIAMFFTRPLSLIFLLVAVISLVWPVVKPYIKMRRGEKQ